MNQATHTNRFWMLLVMLRLSGAVVNVWQRAGEARVTRQSLKDFPAQLGQWRQRGGDQTLDEETQRVLRADDYLSRNFEANGRTASFYVGYYATQRTGATYHSPLNCLPGSGWTLTEGLRIAITPANGGAAFEANRYIVQNGNDRVMVPVGDSEDAALKAATELASQAATQLPPFVPN